jgi:uncharacterized metal-binding protein YceD (DUF177 family)
MSEILSRPVRAGHIKEAVQSHVVVADAAERAALAALYGLPEIKTLRGEFTLAHERGGVISGTLTLQARLVQSCVVSLEPFEARLEETSQIRFVPEAKLDTAEALDPEALDGPDEIPFSGDIIDLGQALAEQLALSLDPYPRKPGAALPAELLDEPENPFAVLKFPIK